jgi:hypothetical protein
MHQSVSDGQGALQDVRFGQRSVKRIKEFKGKGRKGEEKVMQHMYA